MSIHITMQQARDLAEMAVMDRGPEYVYSPDGGCVYYEADGSSSCMVGYIIDRLGFDRSALDDYTNGSSVVALINGEHVSCDLGVQEYLTKLQASQDSGHCWADAYLEAENTLGFPAAVSMISDRPITVTEEVPTDAA